MHLPSPTPLASSRTRRSLRLRDWARRMLARLTARRSAGRLADLPLDALHDIDMPDAQRRAEMARKEWDPPAHWRHPPRGF